ncbi:hypothetical protein [Bdellovibrio sp. KM01]|uniref:hypothetical protein n=1 Tax=Bdellovibrio sp. KM01 TaxID=2748865 RepID=UPI0015EB0B81|nr:hypothetical protein [Bdellovibrio sp. KM01]QLY25296.1 hypothetical protein HW988_18065 [Bdellovibrio sp. KM01]
MNVANKTFLFLVLGLVLAVTAASHRYYYFVSQDQACHLEKIQYSQQLCSPIGEKADWDHLPGLVVIRVPALNANAEAYLLKKEISDVSWVQNPGWFGFKYNCILDRVAVIQNNRCEFL